MRVAYHKTAIVEARCVSQGPEIAGRSQSCWCICLPQSHISTLFTHLQVLKTDTKKSKRFTCIYTSSIVPPLPAGNIVKTSRLLQSRNQDGRSLRISAICKKTINLNWFKMKHLELSLWQKEWPFLTFIGSKLTRPQARAATPLHLCEIAKMPTESGPG